MQNYVVFVALHPESTYMYLIHSRCFHSLGLVYAVLLENFLNFLASQLLPLPEQDSAKTSLSQKYLPTFLDRIISTHAALQGITHLYMPDLPGT